MTGIKHKAIIRELEQLLTGSTRQWPEKSDFLDDIRQRLDELELEAPVVADSIYRRIEERYNTVVFSDKVAALVGE